MPPLSLLIKPASSLCNLKCRYCFYHSLSDIRETASYGVMSMDTLEEIVRKALEFADTSCTFAFQGGEPSVAGLDFFKNYIELVKKHNVKNIRVHNVLQTNGVLIDEEWAEFFAANKFLIGVSLDGPKDFHDLNRVNVNDSGTFNKVMSAISLFDKYKVEYNILSVVSANIAKHPMKIYNFFKKSGFKFIQFIPCLDPLDEIPGANRFSLTPERYESFLKGIFDLWYNDFMKDEYVSIRYFDNLVGLMMGNGPEACGMFGECNCQFVIEADGGVYPCDFYVIDKWRIGDIKSDSFDEMRLSSVCRDFIDSSKHVHESCRECQWFNLCRGGCRRNREPYMDGKPILNYYCTTFKNFFEYSYKRLYNVASIISRMNTQG